MKILEEQDQFLEEEEELKCRCLVEKEQQKILEEVERQLFEEKEVPTKILEE